MINKCQAQRWVLFFLLILMFGACKEEKKIQPNIIVFLVDDMGWQDCSVPFWSEVTPFNHRYRTPNMERLARQGMKFTQAYATPVCSPTRVSLMTGMNAVRHRVTNWTLYKDEIKPQEERHQDLEFPLWNVNGLSWDSTTNHAVYATPLPAQLQKAGYHTIHVGKAHFGAINTPGAEPLNLGFDRNIAGHAAGAPQSYYATANFGNNSQHLGSPWPVPHLEAYYGSDLFLTEVLTREAINALKESDSLDQPFFLYMAHYAVHTPIMADPRFFQTYLDKGLDSIEASYASMVEGMDKNLGDIMDYLEEKGISEETIILFMSDNGGLSAHTRGGEPHTHNKPLNSGKGSIYEGGIREPMLVKWPGVTTPGTVNHNYLIIEDFYPTILEMANASNEAVQEIDGQSFVDFLMDTSILVQDRPLFWHYPNHWGPIGPGIGAFSAIRKGNWKLIYYHLDQSFELFNINEDIGETKDRYRDEPEVVQGLIEELDAYLRSVNAQMPILKSSGEKVPYPADLILFAAPG